MQVSGGALMVKCCTIMHFSNLREVIMVKHKGGLTWILYWFLKYYHELGDLENACSLENYVLEILFTVSFLKSARFFEIQNTHPGKAQLAPGWFYLRVGIQLAWNCPPVSSQGTQWTKWYTCELCLSLILSGSLTDSYEKEIYEYINIVDSFLFMAQEQLEMNREKCHIALDGHLLRTKLPHLSAIFTNTVFLKFQIHYPPSCTS